MRSRWAIARLVARPLFGLEHRLVDRQGAAGRGTEPIEQLVERFLAVAGMEKRRHRDRPAVDHWVERPVCPVLQLD